MLYIVNFKTEKVKHEAEYETASLTNHVDCLPIKLTMVLRLELKFPFINTYLLRVI